MVYGDIGSFALYTQFVVAESAIHIVSTISEVALSKLKNGIDVPAGRLRIVVLSTPCLCAICGILLSTTIRVDDPGRGYFGSGEHLKLLRRTAGADEKCRP